MVSKYVVVFLLVAVSYCLADADDVGSAGGPNYEKKFLECKPDDKSPPGFDASTMVGSYQLQAKSGCDYLGSVDNITCFPITTTWDSSASTLKMLFDGSKTITWGEEKDRVLDINPVIPAISTDTGMRTGLHANRYSPLDMNYRDIYFFYEFVSGDDCLVAFKLCSVEAGSVTDKASNPPARAYHWLVYKQDAACTEKDVAALIKTAQDGGVDTSTLKKTCPTSENTQS